jgi:hypothetical protein
VSLGAAATLAGSHAICLSKAVKQTQVADVVENWLDAHPEDRHYSANSLITSALVEKFPCN